MNKILPVATEFHAAVAIVVLGAGFVVTIASKDQFFFGQFAYVWGPHAAILLLLLLFLPRAAVIAGASLALSLHLIAFMLWERSTNNTNGLAWLGYFASLPGGAVGAVVSAVYLHSRGSAFSSIRVGLTAIASTTMGLIANSVITCSTVLHCRP